MTIPISVMIEGQDGLTWPRWQRIARTVEETGFAGLFRSDHFTNSRPPDKDSLEMIVSLAYLADRTQRIHFGPLVAPLTFRDPTLFARQAAALDDLSGGRMVLGVGAGWQEREHHNFGHELGNIADRMARLREGLEVLTRLLRSDEPVTFEGRFFTLREAILLPRPQRLGGPPILIGGNGLTQTLPLVARYADVWNGLALSPDDFRARNATLDSLLHAAGRPATAVRRTLMLTTYFGRDNAELERRLAWRERAPALAGKSLDEALELLRTTRHALAGTPEAIVAQIRAYAAAGAEEIMLQWFDQEDLDGLRAFAAAVLPLM
jgi:F420-dependent oxidoreductase-like protein